MSSWPDAPSTTVATVDEAPQNQSPHDQNVQNQALSKPPESSGKLDAKLVEPSKQQPKRILGIMPNYRAVSAGAIPPPPTPKQAFIIATKNSFDYSSFVL